MTTWLTHAPRWTALRCPVPADPNRADTFLANVLGPLLDGLVSAGEVTSWYFERRAAGFVEVHVRGGQPAVLVARLNGLAGAMGALERCRASAAPTQVAVVGDATFRQPDLRSRSTRLALNVIAATPSRAARLHAAFDLAIATTVSLSPDPMAGLHRLVVDAGCANGSSGWPPTAPERSAPGSRWRAVRDAVREGRGTVGRWAACLRTTPGADPVGPTALRHLHNQLGLSAGDQHRIYVMLVRSFLATGPARQHGRRTRRAATRCAMA